MSRYSIRENCHINTNWESDTFVGIRVENGKCDINFPLGYHISEDEKNLRRDVLLLFNTLSKLSGKNESTIAREFKRQDKEGFPIKSYLFLIADFYRRGYYKEKEIYYFTGDKGKIDWQKTIKQQKPFMQGTDAFYLNFTIRKNALNENELITLIHEYCVFESFCKIGWLFTAVMPPKPKLRFNRRLFENIVFEKYNSTFNEYNKELFYNMLQVINYLTDTNAPQSYIYGVDPFDYTWEALIDKVFGVKDKEEYYPKTFWNIDGVQHENAELRPDSIMIWNGNIYVLDAKNYKYGSTRRFIDLPQSSDINKQISYAEYIDIDKKLRLKHGNDYIVYNAFLMPYDAIAWSDSFIMRRIGEATAEWKRGGKTYEHIQGILVDVKQLMKAANQNDSLIMELASIIESVATVSDT